MTPSRMGFISAWERGGRRIKSLLHLQDQSEEDCRRTRSFAFYSPSTTLSSLLAGGRVRDLPTMRLRKNQDRTASSISIGSAIKIDSIRVVRLNSTFIAEECGR